MAELAQVYFSPTEVQLMKDLVEINKDMKTLETKKKKLVDKVKTLMIAKKLDNVDVDGSTLSITTSERKTVTKDTKNDFILELVKRNKKHLLLQNIEPDVDGIFAEVGAGTLDKDFVDNYIKVTPVVTLRCN